MTRPATQPLTLASMRAMGVRSIEAVCSVTLCGHSGRIDASGLPDALPVPEVALRLGCSRCGSKSVTTRPAWTEYRASGMAKVT